MKRTVFDCKQWIVDALRTAGVHNAISGKISKDKRQTGSTKEDIVVNSITLNNEYLQNGVFNVNIYVPALSFKVDGIVQTQKNDTRLKVIADLVTIALDDIWKEEYNMTIENQQEVEQGEESYFNIRVMLNAYPN
ncbi:hypothetical protein [Elizabethkingia anophelis]|uniref:hypothetical protein n=1 Tax=Elizabethkingia anophelis TaxID=1117645 RepID=UPI0038919750